MEKLLYILTAILLCCCTNRKIYYEYKGIIVTRIDRDGETRFYYGKLNDFNRTTSYVKSEYSGFNSGLDAFIRFKNDRTVEIISYGGGYFSEHPGDGKRINFANYENPELDSLLSRTQDDGGNWIRVLDVLDLEKERNTILQTKVNAVYP